MPTLNAVITSLVQGDGIDITVTVTKTTGNFVADAITKAWFTVKSKVTDSDANALFQKVITTADVVGVGQITDDGAVSGTGSIRVELTNADTILLSGNKSYPFDLQLLTTSGGSIKPYTPWAGVIKMTPEVTKATA